MSYLALHRWRKFCTKLTSFGEVILAKPPRSSQKSNFLLLRKPLKICNFTTTNAILMKLTTIMYLYETFYVTQN